MDTGRYSREIDREQPIGCFFVCTVAQGEHMFVLKEHMYVEKNICSFGTTVITI